MHLDGLFNSFPQLETERFVLRELRLELCDNVSPCNDRIYLKIVLVMVDWMCHGRPHVH